MDVKGKVLLQFFNKSKFSIKKWDQNVSIAKIFSLLVKFKKLRFSAPLSRFLSAGKHATHVIQHRKLT